MASPDLVLIFANPCSYSCLFMSYKLTVSLNIRSKYENFMILLLNTNVIFYNYGFSKAKYLIESISRPIVSLVSPSSPSICSFRFSNMTVIFLSNFIRSTMIFILLLLVCEKNCFEFYSLISFMCFATLLTFNNASLVSFISRYMLRSLLFTA